MQNVLPERCASGYAEKPAGRIRTQSQQICEDPGRAESSKGTMAVLVLRCRSRIWDVVAEVGGMKMGNDNLPAADASPQPCQEAPRPEGKFGELYT